MSIDLQTGHLAEVRRILAALVPDVEAWIFGSRVSGAAKEFSDVDIALVAEGPLDPGTLAALDLEFAESDLPMKIDVVDWARVEPAFRAVIEKNHMVLSSPAAQ
ncbi:MAG: nucleotidyltransferase domain-containing protein [Deltaproteobacteria bacterium]|nr:nucleotidyltransferase domain-containing protein [Deltaproteobacteria bacterium]